MRDSPQIWLALFAMPFLAHAWRGVVAGLIVALVLFIIAHARPRISTFGGRRRAGAIPASARVRP